MTDKVKSKTKGRAKSGTQGGADRSVNGDGGSGTSGDIGDETGDETGRDTAGSHSPGDVSPEAIAKDFRAAFAALAEIGRGPEGAGYSRLSWTEEDRAARTWFAELAGACGMSYERDANGNLWAWWGEPDGGDALVLGSHLDTVPSGGAYDGAVGVVAGFVAVAAAKRHRTEPTRPVAVVAFADGEGGRSGVGCLGSRLLVGDLDPASVRERRDDWGTVLAEAMRADELDPDGLGRDDTLLPRIGAFVEVHIEQGRALADASAPLGVGTGVWPHGSWRLHMRGEGNHAGATRLADRRDPTLVLAQAINTARDRAAQLGAVATVGRVRVRPNSSYSVPNEVEAWLDARAPDQVTLEELIESVRMEARLCGARHGVSSELVCEDNSPDVDFDVDLGVRLKALLRNRGLPTPELRAATGHDACVLAGAAPAAMLLVRNPTGVSHTPAESVRDADCIAGCELLADMIAEWQSRSDVC